MSARTGQTRKADSARTTDGKKKVEWQGYVTFELNEAHKKTLAKFMAEANDPIDWLPRIAEDGTYEVKTKWDSYNNCYVTNIYCAKVGHVNAGWSLPTRAADYWESQRRAAFVHREVLKGNWGVDAPRTGWTDDKW